MPQISKGTTFVDNQVVTASLLNQLVDGAQLGSQSITQQGDINSVGGVASDDSLLIHDTSTTNLKKCTTTNLLGANIPIVASTITGQATQTSTTAGAYLATSDLALNPQDSATISGTYISADGITITVTTSSPHQVIVGQYIQLASAGTYSGTYRVVSTPTTTTLTVAVPPVYGVGTFLSANGTTVTVTTINPHYLTSGQSVLISASIPSYSGTFTVTVTSSTVFTYTLTTSAIATGTTSYTMSFKRTALVAVPSATSCTFVKKGTANVSGNEIVNANIYVVGDSINNGISTFNNSIIANGDTTFVGNAVYNGNNQFNGTANFVGTIQKQGTTFALPLYTIFQTRETAQYATSWGGAQNTTNLYGTVISLMSLTNYQPKKAGNALILEWNLNYETYDNGVFLVTRTPLSGTGVGVAVPLPYSVNSTNDTFSGITTPAYDTQNINTPSTISIRIIDTSTLAVACTYELRFRSSLNQNGFFNLNRTYDSATGNINYAEVGMSSLIATELCL